MKIESVFLDDQRYIMVDIDQSKSKGGISCTHEISMTFIEKGGKLNFEHADYCGVFDATWNRAEEESFEATFPGLLADVRKAIQSYHFDRKITFTVAECSEFHDMGEYHDQIATVDETIEVWKSISPDRLHGIPSIGINVHEEGTDPYDDVQMDLLVGTRLDLDMLDYYSDITNEPKAIEMIGELVDKLEIYDIDVVGKLDKFESRRKDITELEQNVTCRRKRGR